MYVIQELVNSIRVSDKLLEPFEKMHPHIVEIVYKCNTVALDSKVVSMDNLREIDYVLRYIHDHLNIGRWDEVSAYKRQAYTSASYLKTLILLQSKSSFNASQNVEVARNALQVIDKGFLLGLPIRQNVSLLTDCASLLTKFVNENVIDDNQTKQVSNVLHPNKKLKTDFKSYVSGHHVSTMKCPSIEQFQSNYFNKEVPLIIQDCMSVWPAMTKWLDINYLLNIGGERTVPIELGSSYSSEDFSQKLMTLREFIAKYYNANDGDEIGYLAQHDLLTQIPELVNDIKVPDYCCLKRVSPPTETQQDEENDNVSDAEPEINAWLGPKGTISSLHFDPKDNLLCQVYGSKQVIMFAPSDTKYLYAHDDMPFLSNTSQVDPVNPDFSAFPDFKNTTLYSCVLHTGEMLYIPPKWWHHITALEKSFSVNFWWM